MRRAVGSRALVPPVPRWLLLLASRRNGRAVGDVVLTADDVAGLTANLLVGFALFVAGIPSLLFAASGPRRSRAFGGR